MTREFIMTPMFDKKWKALCLTDTDLQKLQVELLLNPDVGKVMEGTGGLRKMRFALPHRGKSGSVRVLYVDFKVYCKLFLITAYTKNDKDNITEKERSDIKKVIGIIEKNLLAEGTK